VPLYYAYVFVAVAAIGLFSIAGLAGSYSRMLIKTARFNDLRRDHDSLRKDYASLEKQEREKDVQAASLGSLASEVSALYGLTASKLAIPMGKLTSSKRKGGAKDAALSVPISSGTAANFTDDSYFKSVDSFYALRNSAMSGMATRSLTPTFGTGVGIGRISGFNDLDAGVDGPSIWPIIGPITSSFGQREDPVLGNGEGEFHTGIDIGAPNGTPIIATADGVVRSAEMANGYGREVIIDHGHGVATLFGHMSGFAVMAGQTVTRGQVIGYVGHSGRTTGSHLHYEVRIRNSPVNPHKYLRMTLAGVGGDGLKG